jgi:IS5 family transposase
MAKVAYRVRNWKNYNKSLINRGRITFWIDEKSIKSWYEKKPSGKRGRPRVYSNIAIKTVLMLKQVYHLSLRASRGFVESIFQLMNLPIEVPCYTQVCRRQSGVILPAWPVSSESIHLVIDSSGLKIMGEGEWMVRQHGITRRRVWRKLHLGVDEKSRLIVSAVVTEKNRSDDKVLPELLDQYQGKYHQVSADGAYDSHSCFNEITRRGAKATIPPQSHPRHKTKSKERLKNIRDETVWQIQEKGRKEWKHESGYHRRSLVEATFYRYKQILGNKLSSKTIENQRIEALLRCHMLNHITTHGMPCSVVK